MIKCICLPDDESPTGWVDYTVECEWIPAEKDVGIKAGWAIYRIFDEAGNAYDLGDFSTFEALDIMDAIEEA